MNDTEVYSRKGFARRAFSKLTSFFRIDADQNIVRGTHSAKVNDHHALRIIDLEPRVLLSASPYTPDIDSINSESTECNFYGYEEAVYCQKEDSFNSQSDPLTQQDSKITPDGTTENFLRGNDVLVHLSEPPYASTHSLNDILGAISVLSVDGHSIDLNGLGTITIVQGNHGDLEIRDGVDATYSFHNANSEYFLSANEANFFEDSFELRILTSENQQSAVTLKFVIHGENDSPIYIPSNFDVLENSKTGTPVGKISAFDPDADEILQYELLDGADGTFSIDQNTGELRISSNVLLDREKVSSISITVEVTDKAGDGFVKTIPIQIVDVDEYNVGRISGSLYSANVVAENALPGTFTNITAHAVDKDATNNLISYSLDDDASGRFKIDAHTGKVTVAEGAELNREAAAYHIINIRATSTDTSFSTRRFIIDIKDANEYSASPIYDTDPSPNYIQEVTTSDAYTGITAFSEDLDATDNKITYSLTDDHDGRFEIDANTGRITVGKNVAFDSETQPTISLVVRADSKDGSYSTEIFTVTIEDTNEFRIGSISDIDNTANTVQERAPQGTMIGIRAWAVDQDASDVRTTYSLESDSDGRFAIDGNSGVVTVADGSKLKLTQVKSHTIVVRAESPDGSISSRTFLIQVTGSEQDIPNLTVAAEKESQSIQKISSGESLTFKANVGGEQLNELNSNFEAVHYRQISPFRFSATVANAGTQPRESTTPEILPSEIIVPDAPLIVNIEEIVLDSDRTLLTIDSSVKSIATHRFFKNAVLPAELTSVWADSANTISKLFSEEPTGTYLTDLNTVRPLESGVTDFTEFVPSFVGERRPDQEGSPESNLNILWALVRSLSGSIEEERTLSNTSKIDFGPNESRIDKRYPRRDKGESIETQRPSDLPAI